MKLYLTELIKVTSPGENIIALDALRSKYGYPNRDEHGSYWDVDDEVVSLLPKGTTFSALYQGQAEQ